MHHMLLKKQKSMVEMKRTDYQKFQTHLHTQSYEV